MWLLHLKTRKENWNLCKQTRAAERCWQQDEGGRLDLVLGPVDVQVLTEAGGDSEGGVHMVL